MKAKEIKALLMIISIFIVNICQCQINEFGIRLGYVNNINSFTKNSDRPDNISKFWSTAFSLSAYFNKAINENGNFIYFSINHRLVNTYIAYSTIINSQKENLSSELEIPSYGFGIGIGKLFSKHNLSFTGGLHFNYYQINITRSIFSVCSSPNCFMPFAGFEYKNPNLLQPSAFTKFQIPVARIKQSGLQIECSILYNLGLNNVYKTQTSIYEENAESPYFIELVNNGAYIEIGLILSSSNK